MENLTCLAELKLYVHKEHICDDAVKKRLKCNHADIIEEKLVGGVHYLAAVVKSRWQQPATSNQQEDPARDGPSPTARSQGIWEDFRSLIQAVDEEEQEPEYSAVEMSTATLQYSHISIKDLLDYSCTELWLGSFYKTAIQCLDDLELYQLLDLDAEGIDDPDHSQREDMLAE
ncbi:hypothetical protein BS17DRAFT_852627 [Gyrodon lividus]|nr:hypothetical protein BS17DRAFT_852627 [Gyrodon lividus]